MAESVGRPVLVAPFRETLKVQLYIVNIAEGEVSEARSAFDREAFGIKRPNLAGFPAHPMQSRLQLDIVLVDHAVT